MWRDNGNNNTIYIAFCSLVSEIGTHIKHIVFYHQAEMTAGENYDYP